jgi:hypothetical protein
MVLPAFFAGLMFADLYAAAQQNLLALDALFSKALVIEAFCRSPETWERQKGLHYSSSS